MGIEPTWPAWKAGALPLSYTRAERHTNDRKRVVNRTEGHLTTMHARLTSAVPCCYGPPFKDEVGVVNAGDERQVDPTGSARRSIAPDG